MAYQYKREPLTQDEASRLANACTTGEERLIVWTLLDTGLRVNELATLSRDPFALILWASDFASTITESQPIEITQLFSGLTLSDSG